MPDVNKGRDRDEQGQRVVPAEEVSQIVEQRVNEVNAKNAEKMSHLQGQLDALTQQKAEPKAVYTWAQLEKAVSDETISAGEARDVWAKQQREETQELIRSTVVETVQGVNRDTSIQSQIDKYKSAFPDLNREGTDARVKVQTEIQTQMGYIGQNAPTLGLELTALRAIYGPVETLGNTEAHERQSHQEVGGQGGGFEQPATSGLKNASAAQKAFYTDQINKGNYTIEQAQKELDSKFNRHRVKV